MRSLRRIIPSPRALFSFEAAARLESFSDAARELNVTQAAVSLAIRDLENHLGVQLFLRQNRSVVLTDNGRKFYGDVSMGLTHICRAAEELRAVHEPSHVTFSVSTAFASYWMLPRLLDFKRQFPDLDLRLLTTDRDVDLNSEGISLGLRRGSGDWSDHSSMLFAREEIIAVCSPDYLAAIGQINAPEDLLQCELIHLDERFRPRPAWGDWFGAFGVHYAGDRNEGLCFNDYALVIRSGLAGQGVMLGWKYIVGDLLSEGRLVRIVDCEYRSAFGFHILWPNDTPLRPEVAAFRDWLITAHGSAAGIDVPA